MWSLVLTVVLILLGLWVLKRGLPASRQGLHLIIGPSGAGKTLLFQRLRGSSFKATTTSLALNSCILALGHHTARVVDVPGHEKLSPQTLTLAEEATSIVFVLDGSDRGRFSRAAAFLYDVLLLESLASKRLLILVNKSDKPGCLPASILCSELEAEIRLLRDSRNVLLENETQVRSLGPSKAPFTFQMLPCSVEVLAFSAKNDDVSAVSRFFTGKLKSS